MRLVILVVLFINSATCLQQGFVYLKDISPTIIQELRYQGNHNFIGRPINGYINPVCILTLETATQLANVQQYMNSKGYTLKVYDCYRPQKAVDDFFQWSQNPLDDKMKLEFYPYEDKATLFDQGYIAKQSGHTRGSTVDLTIVRLPLQDQEVYHPGDKLRGCTEVNRFGDNTLDMGTGYDCFSLVSHPSYTDLNELQLQNRQIFLEAMQAHGFKVSPREWWHHTLIEETFPQTYFNFDIE